MGTREAPNWREAAQELDIRLPDVSVDQDQEWCEVDLDGERRRIRFHDYDELYEIPGLYERIFYDVLKCDSPRTVCGLLEQQIERSDRDPDDLRVLDVGAGNGIVGAHLEEIGAGEIVGVDIIEEAAEAAERDRPEVYHDYYVLDLTEIPPDTREELESHQFNCMTSVAALGFGDMPPDAFVEAYNLVEPGGFVAFNIKEQMVGERDSSGFAQLIGEAVEEGVMDLKATERYRHRMSTAGTPIHYIAMVGTKHDDLPVGG